MRNEAFSGFHPAVNFIFFLGAIGLGVMIQHPAYILAGCISSALYYLRLHKNTGTKMILSMVFLFFILSLINPLFNLQGNRILFTVFNRPYTFEALCYGMAIAGIFVLMILWFGCYSAVMTSDKFICLFGNLIPSLSLMLVMIFRLVPNLLRKIKQIAGARKAIGKGANEQNNSKEKIQDGMIVLSALTSWALEGSVVTADSMRARGYGAAKRSSFQIYRMTNRDWILLSVIWIFLSIIILTAATGGVSATYTPEYYIAPIRGLHILSFLVYCAYLLIPVILHIYDNCKNPFH